MSDRNDLQTSLMEACDVPGDLAAPHMEQYFGPWAIKEDVFRAGFDRVSRVDLRSHIDRQRRPGWSSSTPAPTSPAQMAGQGGRRRQSRSDA